MTRGQLYLLLKCRTYIGEVRHKDQVYPGLHQAIISQELWDAVQARLAANVQGERAGQGDTTASLLAGRIVDHAGAPLIAAHASKPGKGGGQRRYLYYVSSPLHHGLAKEGVRLSAREIEALVTAKIAALFDDMLGLIDMAGLDIDPRRLPMLEHRGREIAARISGRDRELIRAILLHAEVREGRVLIHCSGEEIATLLTVERMSHAPDRITLTSEARLRRSGRAMRLVHSDRQALNPKADPSLVRLLVQAHRWWGELRQGEVNTTILCEREKVSDAWVSRVLRLAFLSPAVTSAILTGRQPAGLNMAALLATRAVPVRWRAGEGGMMGAAVEPRPAISRSR